MPYSFSELFLAFRQAKTALYFERRGVGLIDLAQFEARLERNLEDLLVNLNDNGGWFDGLPIGQVHVTPKRLATRDASEVIRIGAPTPPTGEAVEIQLRLAPDSLFAIVEVLYLWRFGPALEALLTTPCLGYRLDLRGGSVSPTRRFLFEYWQARYNEFRSAPLTVARRELASGGAAVILSADMANFYDSIDPSFLIADSFLGAIQESGGASNSFDVQEYIVATRSLLGAYERYYSAVRRLTGLDWRRGVPIGALTSRVIANVALAPLDAAIGACPDVLSYRRYVDDFVIVGRAGVDGSPSLDEVLNKYVPHASLDSDEIRFNEAALGREGSVFRLRRRKTKIHHVSGIHGRDFIAAIWKDFATLVSERRAFLDDSSLSEDAASHLIRAGTGDGGELRVLRDADRSKLERFALSNALRSLERVSLLVDQSSAKEFALDTLGRLRRFLADHDDWVESLDLGFRLLRLAAGLHHATEFHELCKGMDARWGTVERLEASSGRLEHEGRPISNARAWNSMRRYLQARRIEAICSALRAPSSLVVPRDWLPGGAQEGARTLGSRALVKRARLLAASDLRALDREDDSLATPGPAEDDSLAGRLQTPALLERLGLIDGFIKLCRALGDDAWVMSPARLFLCPRPPSYFDIARRWLYRSETEGFGSTVFDDLLRVVNAVRGTQYRDPVGSVIDEDTVDLSGSEGEAAGGPSRLVLGNLVVPESAFEGAATRVSESTDGQPLLSIDRLRALTFVLRRSSEASKQQRSAEIPSTLVVLPELSVPRKWFRSIANHVVRLGDYGLVTGLEYRHDRHKPFVRNQVFAVLPGPFGSVATWPWTKRFPAREEARQLRQKGVTFPPPGRRRRRGTVVQSRFGRFSVLICSELMECRATAGLLGRVEIVLSPSWNRDTDSYDHLIKSVALQLNAVVAIANNGHYSDCRAWAPLQARWSRDLCRLVQRDDDEIVSVDLPVESLRRYRGSAPSRTSSGSENEEKAPSDWQPLPPEFP